MGIYPVYHYSIRLSGLSGLNIPRFSKTSIYIGGLVPPDPDVVLGGLPPLRSISWTFAHRDGQAILRPRQCAGTCHVG